MSNVYKPLNCPQCHKYNFKPPQALYTRLPGKGFVRIGWLHHCGHTSIDDVKS